MAEVILWSVERRHFQWPWTALNPDFKITPLFNIEYLTTAKDTTKNTNGVSFRMTLSDLAKYLITRSIARSFCDSWASCSNSGRVSWPTVWWRSRVDRWSGEFYGASSFRSTKEPPTKEEVNAFARACLSVCLSVYVSKTTQKRVHGFGWNVACRRTSGHGGTD